MGKIEKRRVMLSLVTHIHQIRNKRVRSWSHPIRNTNAYYSTNIKSKVLYKNDILLGLGYKLSRSMKNNKLTIFHHEISWTNQEPASLFSNPLSAAILFIWKYVVLSWNCNMKSFVYLSHIIMWVTVSRIYNITEINVLVY